MGDDDAVGKFGKIKKCGHKESKQRSIYKSLPLRNADNCDGC